LDCTGGIYRCSSSFFFAKLGAIFFAALLVSSIGSFLYIWYQCRLKWKRKMYCSNSGGRDLLMACAIPIFMLLVSAALFVTKIEFLSA
jgi:hypothetical protein